MLIGFIGAPCSGKTTVAARTFADLKDKGIPCEFISEYARTYIAKEKWEIKNSNENRVLVLNDRDQTLIYRQQYTLELMMKSACNQQSVIITDTSTINTFAYMENENFQSPFDLCVRQYDLLFVCGLVSNPLSTDSNRLHSEKQAKEIHSKLETIIGEIAKTEEGSKIHYLGGDSNQRMNTVVSVVLKKLF